MVNAPANGDQRDTDQEELITCETRMFEQLNRCGLAIDRPSIAPVITSPARFNRLFPGSGGALYGPATHGWAAAFQRPGCKTRTPGLYLAGGGTHPGAGVPMAALSRSVGGAMSHPGPRFDALVGRGGYRWWYLDAISDDGRFGLTLIAFIGSVFSPYYAWSGWADPLDHCAVNVALYGAGGRRWAMTERGRGALRRTAARLTIGPSSLHWDGQVLTAEIEETTAPAPSRLRGTVRLHPQALTGRRFDIGAEGGHSWFPIAPRARVEVCFANPACAWSGDGYFDANAGDEPLQMGFSDWDWSRAHRPRDTLLFYDMRGRNGARASLALKVDGAGAVDAVEPPPPLALPRTLWRMPRTVRGEAGAPPRLRETLEDTPFYARSRLEGTYGGEHAVIVHESLSLDRLRMPIVRAMLPFRMPRVLR